jgi:hypothetical protein
VKIGFPISTCKVEDGRTTVESDLYVIQDERGYTLIVPLGAGDLTPKWEKLEKYEDPYKMPSAQWLVRRVDENASASKIHLINREFSDVRLEHVQVYDTPHPFFAMYGYVHATYGDRAVTYEPVNYKEALVTDKSFKPVTGDNRTNPYLGYYYIPKDQLNYVGYSFEYYHYYTSQPGVDKLYMGIDPEWSTKDTLLRLDEEKTYFQLSLPDSLERWGTEKYGIGTSLYVHANDSLALLTSSNPKVAENLKDIAILERYYYYFMVDDYFKYRQNDNYIVLEQNASNARYAYTRDAWSTSRKLNKAAFYLRYTYDAPDNTGKEYYALLNRIPKTDFHYLTGITGLSITDTLRAVLDQSHGFSSEVSFGVVLAGVTDYWQIRAEVKTLSESVSSFAVLASSEPLYRSINPTNGVCDNVWKFYAARSFGDQGSKDYLFEDAHSFSAYESKDWASSYGNGINYLGYINNKIDEKFKYDDAIFPHNFNILIDTAYVHRPPYNPGGTIALKPQYMLAVGLDQPYYGCQYGYQGCYDCGDGAPRVDYIYARYLINATDSARVDGIPEGFIRDRKYIWETKWERLAFVNAVHAKDALYILNEQTYTNPKTGQTENPIVKYYDGYDPVSGKTGPDKFLNFDNLDKASVIWPAKPTATKPVVKVLLNDNYHKDCVFSFRYVNRQFDWSGLLPTDERVSQLSEFAIESETTNRAPGSGRMIAPMNGGWLKIMNGVPTISRGSYEDPITAAEIWQVEKGDGKPTSNEAVQTSQIQVVSGTGSVTILNAAGKKVTISNVLGQKVAAAQLNSDHATIDVPKGIVIVAVEGENAVKAVVK